jgi:tRNA pseudouridine38-40 synthase
LSYLNQRGVIPATAVIKRGERRDRPFQEKKVFDATSFASGGHGNVVEAEEADETEQTLDSQQLVDLEG